jgi:hypothetical protein
MVNWRGIFVRNGGDWGRFVIIDATILLSKNEEEERGK